jgi:hypothetical protein
MARQTTRNKELIHPSVNCEPKCDSVNLHVVHLNVKCEFASSSFEC